MKRREVVWLYLNILMGALALLFFAHGTWLLGRAFGWIDAG